MQLLPIPLFPDGSLNSSVITTIWVGVFVVVYFNLRFGWVLSGLVIPGYVVPLIILKPMAAGVIFLEGILTYFLVWIYSEYLSKFKLWSSFFGRDRFFAIILCSVIIRILLDGWLLPTLSEYLTEHSYLEYDFQNNLHAFGIIIVALIANNFWKPGLVRGIIPMAIIIGITYIIVRFILMNYTNFHISRLEYMYSDLAQSIMATPKAYIVIVVTAFIASRMNVRYGWDFNGLLIPALLALQWYRPWKIVTTFVEALVILVISSFFLKQTYFEKSTVEGGRKILLFFNVSFVYKIILSYILYHFFPSMKITDFYGFGYLVPTLIAIKMHTIGVWGRVVRTTLQSSLVAILVASVIGFALTLLPKPSTLQASILAGPIKIRKTMQDISEVMRADKINLYRGRVTANVVPTPADLDLFTQGLLSLQDYINNNDVGVLNKAASIFTKIKYELSIVNNQYIYLKEKDTGRGWGAYILNLKTDNQMLLEVPSPLDEWGSLESSVWLFKIFNSKAFAVGGTSELSAGFQHADVLKNQQTFFQTFHKIFSKQDVLQVRSYTPQYIKAIADTTPDNKNNSKNMPSSLWVKSNIPASLDLTKLKEVIGNFQIHWNNPPFENIQRDATREGFAELILSSTGIRSLMARGFVVSNETPIFVNEKSIEGYLGTWLFDHKDELAASGTDIYVVPKIEDLLFFDEVILTPLLKLIKNEYQQQKWTKFGLDELRIIGIAASAIGYEIIRYKPIGTNEEFLILSEKTDSVKKRYWGTYVFRLNNATKTIIQIPRPLFEINTFEYAVNLFSRTKAFAFLIAGSHPYANRDYSSDLTLAQNKSNIFNLVNQVLLREMADDFVLDIQVRAFAIRPDVEAPTADALVSVGLGFGPLQPQQTMVTNFVNQLKDEGLNVQVVEGDPTSSGYDVGLLPQYHYLAETLNKTFVVVWVSPLIRANYREESENRVHMGQFNALYITGVEMNLASMIANAPAFATDTELTTKLIADLKEYLANHNFLTLQAFIKKWQKLQFQHVLDTSTQQAFLVVYSEDGKMLLVSNLFPTLIDKTVTLDVNQINAEQIQQYILSNGAFLQFGRQK